MDNMKLKTIIEDILTINEAIDLRKIEDQLHRLYDFDNVEEEGRDRLRFDYNNGRDHMWINDDGTVEGGVPKDTAVKKLLKKHKLTITGL